MRCDPLRHSLARGTLKVERCSVGNVAYRCGQRYSFATHDNVTPATTLTQHLLIRGHVQGVSYRWFMVQAAQQRGVRGWVRNRHDGCVEALVTGPADAVQSLIEWAHQGPPHARVDRVEVTSVPAPSEPFADFAQRETV